MLWFCVLCIQYLLYTHSCTFISLFFHHAHYFIFSDLLVCFRFQQIRNVFGAKSAKSCSKNSGNVKNTSTSTSGSTSESHRSSKINQIDEVNGQQIAVLNPAASELYLAQLKNFISKHSTSTLEDRPNRRTKSKQPEQTQYHHHQHLSGSSELKSQCTQFKRKCKRAVYKFMKGLFDERKLQKFTLHQQPEPIYFEVSQSTGDYAVLYICITFKI